MAFEDAIAWLLDIVLSPALWFSLVLAVIYALVIFVWSGRGWSQLARDLAASILGFGIGHLIGALSGLGWFRLGQIQLFWGTLGALPAIAVGRWLGGRQAS